MGKLETVREEQRLFLLCQGAFGISQNASLCTESDADADDRSSVLWNAGSLLPHGAGMEQ